MQPVTVLLPCCPLLVGRIDSPAESIMHYHEDTSFSTYSDSSFTPEFGISALENNLVLNMQAHEVCDGDYSCLFDISRTDNITVGKATHEIRMFKEAIKHDLGKENLCCAFLLSKG